MIGYLIEISLLDLVRPTRRIIQIPGRIHFKKLQDIIQIAFSWRGVSDGIFYLPDGSKAFTEEDANLSQSDIKLRSMRYVNITKYMEQYQELFYVYHHWVHHIRLIAKMMEIEENYAKVITYEGENPKEDELAGENNIAPATEHYPLALTNLLLRDPLNLKKK